MLLIKSSQAKGQESAPFEVLIGVILMGFVLYIGFNAMESMTRQDCENRLTRAVETFRIKLENVVELGIPANFDFRAPTCFKNQRIKIDEIADEAICASTCDTATPNCLSITVTSLETTKRFCLRTALKTYFPETYDICQDKSAEGYTLVDLRDNIYEGHYYLLNQTPERQTYPVICAYYKK